MNYVITNNGDNNQPRTTRPVSTVFTMEDSQPKKNSAKSMSADEATQRKYHTTFRQFEKLMTNEKEFGFFCNTVIPTAIF